MSGLETELARLQERLATEPHNKDLIARRIAEVQALIKAAPASDAAAPEIEAAVEMEVETATLPKAKRSSRS